MDDGACESDQAETLLENIRSLCKLCGVNEVKGTVESQ